jgi:prevent-host-death family protein
MKPITVTELRKNIFNLLEEILNTGVPLEINKGGRLLRIAPVEPVDKFADLVYQPDVINGDPEDLVHIEWEYKLDLP